MTPARFNYVVPQDERTSVHISKELLLILRMCAREKGLTTATLLYMVIKEGLAVLIRREKIKDAELIRKILGLYDETIERRKREASTTESQ